MMTPNVTHPGWELNRLQLIREAQLDSLARSVGRANGHRSVWSRLFHRNGKPMTNGEGKLRRGHAEFDFKAQDEDVWRVLRDVW